jgi:hypothetical protein
LDVYCTLQNFHNKVKSNTFSGGLSHIVNSATSFDNKAVLEVVVESLKEARKSPSNRRIFLYSDHSKTGHLPGDELDTICLQFLNGLLPSYFWSGF